MRSTRNTTEATAEGGAHDAQPKPMARKRDMYVKVYNATKRAMYTDQTGRFPITSSRESKYQVRHGGSRDGWQLHRLS